MQSPDPQESSIPLEPRPISQILTDMSAAIGIGDAPAAALLLREAETTHAGEPVLSSSLAKCKVVVNRAEWLNVALNAMRRDIAKDRFTSAVGHFREALGLSRGLPLLKVQLDQEAERHCEQLLPKNWRIAETMLDEIATLQPPFLPDSELREKISLARQEEANLLALHKAERLERIRSLDSPQSATASLTNPALDAEGGLNLSQPGFPHPWRTRLRIPGTTWVTVKNFCALAATTAMLGMAALLVWHHLSNAPLAPPRVNRASSQAQQKSFIAPDSSVFENVPGQPSDQDAILNAVHDYLDQSGKKMDDQVVDEVAIQTNHATVKYRHKDKTKPGTTAFALIRQGQNWKVQP